MDKLIINFTPTGMIPTKEMTPNVPIVPSEIIDDVLLAYDYFGITMVHLHARDENGTPTYKKEIYREIIEGIKKYSDVIICVSTSGRTFKTFEERTEVLDLKPEMASMTLSSLNFNKQASINEPDFIIKLAEKMRDLKIKPELEAFDVGMINYSKYLISKGLLEPPYYFNLILGNIACAQANPLSLGHMLVELPSDSIWSAGGIGNSQIQINTAAIAFGGGVRVGLEDNIWFDNSRTKLASNIFLVNRIYEISKTFGRDIMSPEELRKILWRES